MRSRAAAKGRKLFSLAAACLAASLLLVPSAEASRDLPASLSPALEPPIAIPEPTTAETSFELLTAGDRFLFAALSSLDEDEVADLLERRRFRPLSAAVSRDLASGVSTRLAGSISLGSSDLGWKLHQGDYFLEPDPLGPVDSPNLYQAFGFDGLNLTDPFGLVLPTKIGWVYRVEGFIDGEPVEYEGSARELRSRFSKHKWKALIRDRRTTVLAKRVYGELNVEASNRQSLLSARNEALRSVEQDAMNQAEKRVEEENQRRRSDNPRKRILNRARAAEDSEVWRKRHNVKASRKWKLIKKPGSVKIVPKAFALFAVRDAYMMANELKRSQYTWAPYTLEDEAGDFLLEVEERFLGKDTYYKRYLGDAGESEKVQIEGSEFYELHKEAEALWGTLDWKGDFVPGLLNPELPTGIPGS